VASRTQALQEAVDIARQADEEKRRLIVHSNAAVEEERRRIAVEIHDQLGAALIAVRLEASALQARAEALQDADLTRGARRIAGTAEALYATTRDIVKSLRPEVIDTLGLIGALEDLVRNLDKVHPTCRISLVAEPGVPNLRGEQAMPAYRVTQEALTNVFKHAQATRAEVRLAMGPGGQQLQLHITDNGKGFDAGQTSRTGIGLIGMRERVSAAGGRIHVSSSPAHGTQVAVTLPLQQGEVSA
jgi:two-component system sensor histidine kinase UhpB